MESVNGLILAATIIVSCLGATPVTEEVNQEATTTIVVETTEEATTAEIIEEKYTTVWTTADLNIRKYPVVDSERMGQYDWGTKLDVIYINDEWAREKKTGFYVNRTFLSEVEINTEDFYIEKEFKLTAYCPCYICSEGYEDNTSTGVKAKEGRTIAVDPKVIPYGTEVEIDGNTYIAEDCGGGVKGNHIDIYFNTHSETDSFGVKYKTVRIYKNPI